MHSKCIFDKTKARSIHQALKLKSNSLTPDKQTLLLRAAAATGSAQNLGQLYDRLRGGVSGASSKLSHDQEVQILHDASRSGETSSIKIFYQKKSSVLGAAAESKAAILAAEATGDSDSEACRFLKSKAVHLYSHDTEREMKRAVRNNVRGRGTM